MKISFYSAILVSLLMIIVVSPSKLIAAGPANASNGHARVVIPPHAVEVAPGVFSLGTAMDKGRVVEGYAIIKTRKKKFAKPDSCNNDGVCDPGEKKNCPDCRSGGGEEIDTSSCYEYTRGVKWKEVEGFIVNPANTRGLSSTFVTDNLNFDINKWELAAGNIAILGYGSDTTEILAADLDQPDDSNEVYFADVDYPGAIAVTIVWGIFRGPPSWRELVEWDQVYDDVDFDWSDSGEAGKMDFESIATHELGHSVGVNDLYDSLCIDQTMYGYAGSGETNKQTLEDGDEIGIWELYNR